MVSIKIDATTKPLQRTLAELKKKAGDLRPLMKSIGEHMLRSVDDNFDAETDPDGRPWKPVRPETMARKRVKKILHGMGRLRGSVNYRADARSVEIGTPVIYGAIHQLGGKTRPHVIRPRRAKALAWLGGRHPVKKVDHPGSVIPARPYLGVGKRDRTAIGRIVKRHMSRKDV